MTESNPKLSAGMRNPVQFKPPIPARPKNLVVLNSKNLPKPPENVLTGNVTNFIKELNLDAHDEKSPNLSDKIQSSENNTLTPISDEEDIDGYLEPVSLSFNNVFTSGGKNVNKPPVAQNSNCEQTAKIKPVSKFGSISNLNVKEKGKTDGDDGAQQYWSHSHRPLPLPPVKKELDITDMPWYKNVDRKKGEELLKDGFDGYFLVRPSSKEDAFLTLMLWFHSRLYNIPIRKRKDGKYALGTPKSNEQCFESIDEMIKYYKSEKLLLYSNGAKAGRTLLTTYPP